MFASAAAAASPASPSTEAIREASNSVSRNAAIPVRRWASPSPISARQRSTVILA